MSAENQTSDTTIPLPSVLNLGTAEELREQFVQSMMVDPDMVLDASNVTTITTPCLQIILSTGRSLEEIGSSLTIKSPSPAFNQAFEDLGFTETLKKWSTE